MILQKLTVLSNSLVTSHHANMCIKEMMRMNDDDSSVVDDGDGVGITMVMWAKMEGAGQQSG